MISKPWLTGTTEIHPSVGPTYYNSALSLDGASYTTNARLTIYLRVFMIPNPLQYAITTKIPDAADPSKPKDTKFIFVPDPNSKTTVRPVEVRDWSTGEFEFFRVLVKATAEQFWDNTKLCLIPPPSYRGLYYPQVNPTHQLNVDCRFEIVWAKGPADAHIVFYGTCLGSSFPVNNLTIGSFAGGGIGSLDTGDFIPSVTMSNEIGIAGPNSPVGHSNTIWHEFGHAIGLPHIGITSSHKPCLKGMANPFDGNFPACYLGPNPDESLNVMGAGDKVGVRNSLPWLLRAPFHTETFLADWRVSLPTRPPRKLS